MPYADPEKAKERARRYYHEHKSDPTYKKKKKRYMQSYRKKNREKINEYFRNRRKEIWKVIREKLGGKCLIHQILGEVHPEWLRLDLHEKNGAKHPHCVSYYYARLDELPQRFVLLCRRHHKIVEFCLNQLNMSWDDFITRLKADG